MRIARFSAGGEPRYGLVELAEDHGENPESIAVLNADPLAGPVKLTGERVLLSEARLLAPVIPRSKVVGVGRNYAAHAAELGNPVPDEPVLFFKPNTSVIGPGEPVICPPETQNLHFEGELAVVIGRICRRVPIERTAEVIFGYTIGNDITARDLQSSDAQWTRAKGFDTFCPLGPWIVTHFAPDDVRDLDISTTVNGEARQAGNTSEMLRGVPELIAYISAFTTLLPGDVILTGTPAGVGQLAVGDEVSVSVSQIGTLSNPVMAG
ncbi:MAG: fumarylacetoacetate hydrolase family protein [Propionibacteriaceae bacterium]|jgi:2-keto-4-pentenoate hydratase/2-oxohepta-3-ene-1,7-dioic acid hydratase in catechol pathway|nr:fumarylacetoacetate hydrolase family protein [Propionibacteriaceae bacterium]